MAKGIGKKTGNAIVWIILLLLIIGLAGFGVGNFGGSVQSIGAVGKREITTDTYARALQQELRAQQANGTPLPLSEAIARGLDQQVRGRVIIDTALDGEAARLGVSIDDAALRDEILAIPAFHGPDGQFSRDSYRFTLERSGLSEAEFEASIRTEAARGFVQGAVIGGIKLPRTPVDTLMAFIGERRSYAQITLASEDLDMPLPSPDASAITEYYEANAPAFTTPRTKQLTYAWLTPDMMLDSLEIPEDTLRALYEERRDEYNTPESRIVERLVFESPEAAAEAMARIDSGESDFEDEVAARGLDLSDIDMGIVGSDDLPAPVAALPETGVTGPHDSDLGPAIFRVNAILEAQETPFEDVREDLRARAATERAARAIAEQMTDLDDRLAAGATLEELADETRMELGKLDYFAGQDADIAAYEAFREAAEAVQPDDFPELVMLEDGGVFALRLDTVIPPTPRPLEDVRAEVVAGWEARETQARLTEQAEALKARLEAGEAIDTLGPVERQEALTRAAVQPAPLSDALFALAPGEAAVAETDAGVALVQLEAILAPDSEDPATDLVHRSLESQLVQSLAQDIYGYYAQALVDAAGLELNQQAINAVHAQFR
ncbi:peptidyl-prolyl cis-trans isomerase D [Rhodovulum imhoffii]|uniref:Peptidyl-prolyl cis-trans isomerase D n=1 Tax=Rhodovulum imhoffii TaxID=365340 RepID=A0A2T5BQI8_9RHOB|nr:peptidylprolyl isomerase [Rhodovulum imhoffii]PTN01423.1 peptidyl-prolyl cis-trans isomerase D [Rhodovulum imhoffii]